jgi:hypothetical protein
MAESSSALAVNHDIRHYRGDTFERVLSKTNLSQTLDLSTLIYKLQVWETSGNNPAKVLEFSSGAGITATANAIRIYKSAAAMRIPAAVYRYDLEVTFPASADYPEGRVITWMEGRFTIVQDVTRVTS